MFKNKKLLVMLMIMTLTLGLAACGKKESKNNSGNSSVENSEAQNNSAENQVAQDTTDNITDVPAQEEAVTYPVDVQDSDGNTITIEAKPETIVSVAPNMTELVFALGEGEHLIGRTEYCDYPAEAQSIETIGSLYSPDIEKIVSLEPDIVLVSTHFSDENEQKLKDLGIQVICLYEKNDIYGVYKMIDTLGTILDRKQEATKLVDDMKATFDEVSNEVAGLEQPTVYYVVSYGESGDFTATGDTFINGLITLAGGDNIAKDGTEWSYSLEKLLEADPDVIITKKGESENFKASENYKELTAVKEGHVYEMDTNLFDRQGYRNAEGVKELAKILYPDHVK